MPYQSLLDSLLNCFRIDTASGNVSVYGSLQQGSVKASLLAANSDGVLVSATGVSDYIKIGIGNLTATGTPSSTTFLRGDNTWATISIPSGDFQPLDADLTAIASLPDSSGLLRKVDATPTWVIDSTEYLTMSAGDTRYESLSSKKNTLVANSTTYYYSVTAVNTGLAAKLSTAGGTMTGDLTLQYSYPTVIFNDTSSGGVYRLMVDGGQFYLKYGTGTGIATLLTVNSTGGFTLESTITSTGFKTATGTAAQFLKANGTIDSTLYQPLDADLTAIAALADSSGLLRKVDATPSWTIDTAEYMTITTSDARYQVLSGRKDSIVANNTSYYYSVTAVNNALATKMGVAGGTFTGDLNLQYSYPTVIFNDTSSGGVYRLVSDGGAFVLRYGTTTPTLIVSINSVGAITANSFVKDGGTASQFLKANGTVDSSTYITSASLSGYLTTAAAATTYQPLNANLTAITGFGTATGILKKINDYGWALDTSTYLTSADLSGYQVTSNLSTNLTASASKYPSVNAVNTGLALKLDLAGGTMSGGLTLTYSVPTIALNDNSTGVVWNVLNDASTFKLNNGATNKFYIFSNGNAAFANNLTAASFIKSGGTSAQFLMADGSVSTNPGWITGITSANVTTALGYTPYNSTNPSGYTSNVGTVTSVSGTGTVSGLTLSGTVSTSGSLTLGGTLSLTSGNVTGALGYTPYNSTNPSGYITSSASISGTSAGVSVSLSGTNATNVIYAAIADNDFFRIRVGGDATNAGWAEIATADDGTEPIYVRQYTGVFSSITRTATLLDGAGNTSFPGNISGGYILGSYFNSSAGNSENPTIGQIWTQSTVDNYLRKSTPAHFISQLGLITSSNIGSQSVSNAATLGGYGPNQSGGANTIVQRDGNGYIQNSYFYTSGGGSERGTGISYVAGFNSSDYYIRSYTMQGLASSMSGATMNINGSSTSCTGNASTAYGWSNTPDSWYGIGQTTSASGATAVGGYYPWTLSYHTGLALSAHSAYGGIRFYNQNYPTGPLASTPVMQIINYSIILSGNTTSTGSFTGTAFYESSSIVHKNILATNPMTSLNIDVIKYKRKNSDIDDIRYGYSAEQINSLMPELTNKDVTAVKYLDVHTLLIAELQREIKELKAKLK